ncbi:hypothetical protein HPP92_022320 [Vanilla planifolia]|uniref:RING-type E3 ubiquitin transferase n=1 Tax=Vanilla planifolia TaxID=51239 RepID=A0A835Q0C5_VANPL|nr:hypothetical protein HPP92_022320 [Vanilla planifolia]
MTTTSSSQGMSFPVVVIAIVGILSTASVLLAYYVIVIKCCLNLDYRPPNSAEFLRRLTRSRRRHTHLDPVTGPPSPRRGLDPATIRSLPTFRHSKLSPAAASASECAICLIEFRNEEKLRLLPDCAHVFHVDCIDVWLQSNANCPLCRAEIKARPFPPLAEDRVVVMEVKDEAPMAAGKSLGDEWVGVRREMEETFAVQPMRRSLSMDSSCERHLCLSIQEILRKNPDLFVFRERNTGEGSSNGGGGGGGGSGRGRRLLFSCGRSRSSRSAVLPSTETRIGSSLRARGLSSTPLSVALPFVDSSPEMGFVSFAGRVLFAAVFLLSAYQEFVEFGVDGGPAAKALRPKFNLFLKHVTSHLGFAAPRVEMKHVIGTTIVLKGLGGLLFIFSSNFGASLLLLYLAFITPIVYDFYNYDIEKAEFVQLFIKFTQNLALFGALLFFLGMKNSIPKRQLKKKAPKTKTG